MSNIILPSAFTRDEDRLFGRTHSLRDQWLQARLVEWFANEETTRAWICTLREGGRWAYWKIGAGMSPPTDKRTYARTIVSFLNRELHFGGAWVGGWMDHGWTRFYLLWKDRDGDIQFPIDTPPEKHWREIRNWGAQVWGEHAASAMALWTAAQEAMEVRPDQQIKLAQGQTKAEANYIRR